MVISLARPGRIKVGERKCLLLGPGELSRGHEALPEGLMGPSEPLFKIQLFLKPNKVWTSKAWCPHTNEFPEILPNRDCVYKKAS